VDLRDLGDHRLKDLTAPVQLFQLLILGLSADFPPLRTLAAHLTNLAELTGLVGRQPEVAAFAGHARRGRRAVSACPLGRCCVAPTQGRAEAVASSGDQITTASSSTATATRRFGGSSTVSS
jgi:hypothetical protein